MCGFVGRFKTDAARAGNTPTVSHALASLQHRGPDGHGVLQNEWVTLCHTRLAIIDTTDSGKQPMFGRSGRYVIVFNGEIYNFKELVRDHLQDDNSINCQSDTAVLLELYERYGVACLDYLNGMFAFAIVDLQAKTLFLARDRFGEKPLYWRLHGGEVLFSSELQALKTLSPEIPWKLDPKSIAVFHMIGSIPPPATIYRETQALRPGCWVRIKAEGSLSEGCYWSIGERTRYSAGPSSLAAYAEVIEKTRARLLEAAQSRMVSDVQVGLFLSGGFDSGALLSLLQYSGLTPINSLCLDFHDNGYSEFELAKITAEQFDGVLHGKVITPSNFLDSISGYFTSMDQPTSDGYNTYFVSKAARELGIKVWLSGIGGDELFGGYPFFKRITKLKRLARAMQLIVPTGVVNQIAPRLLSRLRMSRGCHLADGGDATIRAYQLCRNPLPWRNALQLLAPTIAEDIQDIDEYMEQIYPYTNRFDDDFQRATALESSMYMRSQLLRDLDNFSMAHSIELRAPYLDHRLFEYVLGLPQEFKINGGSVKPLLANALPRKLPDKITKQSKRGFTFPIEEWLKRELAGTFEEYVLSKDNEAFLNLDVASTIWNAYRNEQIHSSVVWDLYAFSRWIKDHHESV